MSCPLRRSCFLMQGFRALYLQIDVLQSASEASPVAPCYPLITFVFVPHYFKVHWCGTPLYVNTAQLSPHTSVPVFVVGSAASGRVCYPCSRTPLLWPPPQGSGLRCCPPNCWCYTEFCDPPRSVNPVVLFHFSS